MRKIAEEAGVSAAVVSRLFRGDPALRISDRRREEIFEARDRLGGVKVRPSRLSHVISSPVSPVSPVSPLAPEGWLKKAPLEHPSYAAFARELKKGGFSLEVEPVAEAEAGRWVKGWMGKADRPDGILVQTNYCTGELANLLREYAIPHVSNDFTREHLQINTVCHHATAGMRQAVEHLAGLGHRRFAFVGPAGHYRYSMMAGAMTQMGLVVDPQANCRVESLKYLDMRGQIREYAAQAFEDWRRRHMKVTALICGNDHVAMGVIDAMRQGGLMPGRDLSVVGYDNIEEQFPTPGERAILTTVHNPFERVGRRMAELLLNQIMYGQTAIIHERVPVSLVVRETTGLVPQGSLS